MTDLTTTSIRGTIAGYIMAMQGDNYGLVVKDSKIIHDQIWVLVTVTRLSGMKSDLAYIFDGEEMVMPINSDEYANGEVDKRRLEKGWVSDTGYAGFKGQLKLRNDQDR